MKLRIKVKTNAKHESVEEMEAGVLRVAVKAAPVEGKANEAVIRVLSKHFSVPKTSIRIVSGLTAKMKWVEVGDLDFVSLKL